MSLRSPFSQGFTRNAADILAFRFSALAEPHRLAILALLNANGELTVGELTARLDIGQETVSYHLKRLIAAGLVVKRKDGARSFCKVDHRAVGVVASALDPWQAS